VGHGAYDMRLHPWVSKQGSGSQQQICML